MPYSAASNAASDLGLHCLAMSHKKEARLIWFKYYLCIDFSKMIIYYKTTWMIELKYKMCYAHLTPAAIGILYYVNVAFLGYIICFVCLEFNSASSYVRH